MNILHIITQRTWGGAQRYVSDIITNMPEYTHTLAIGCPEQKNDLQKHISSHITLTHLKRQISPLHDLLAIIEIAKLYKKTTPHVVHLNSSKAGVLGSLAAKLVRKKHRPKIIYTAHGWVFNEPLPKWKQVIYTYAEKYTANIKDNIITLSPQDKKTAKEKLNIQSTVIPLGIQPTTYKTKKEAQKELSIPKTNNTIVGCIANHYKTKGLDTLIRSYAQNDTLKKNTKLYIIGDGPEHTKLQTLIETNQLENTITLCGKKHQAATLLKAFDLCVMPSHKEGLPYTLLEILQANIPVIATTVGGIPSVLKHKKNSLLVKPQQSDKLAEAINWAIDHKETMTTYAKHAHKVGMRYTIDNMISETKQCYETICEL